MKRSFGIATRSLGKIAALIFGGFVAVGAPLGPLGSFVPSAEAFESVPDVRLRDAWDRTYELSGFRGMPILVLYEDKDSVHLNQPLKAELAALAKHGNYKRSVALVAVADVSSYDYWPVRGIVKGAIQDESHKQGTLIYCDWDGRVRHVLGLGRGTSNVVLYGRTGQVLFRGAGALSTEQRALLLSHLRREVDGQR